MAENQGFGSWLLSPLLGTINQEIAARLGP